MVFLCGVLILFYLCSKRIEAQLQEIEQKSEKKKLEVRALDVCPCFTQRHD